MKIFISLVIGAVALAILGGLFVVGSPQQERARRFDRMRRDSLLNLHYQIAEYWRVNKTLPATLADLTRLAPYSTLPVDPVSKQLFGYEVRGEKAFAVCATFSRASEGAQSGPSPEYYGVLIIKGGWSHPAGYYCLERTVEEAPLPESQAATAPRPL